MDAALATGFLTAGSDLRQAALDLVAREEPILRRVVARYVHDAATVDDLMQEIALKILRRADSVRDPLYLRGWIFQLARNACLDYLRQQQRRAPLHGPVPVEPVAGGSLGRAPSEALLTQERVRAVRRALDELPASQREVIRLRIDEDLDHEAIAARLRISRQAVEVRLCRGRAALKERLDAVLGGDL